MIKKIDRVLSIVPFYDKLLIVGDEKSTGADLKIPANGNRPLVPHNGHLYYTLEEFGPITVLDKYLEKIAEIPAGYNLYHRFEDSEYILLPSRNTLTYWQLYDPGKISDTGKAFRYQHKFDEYAYSFDSLAITCFSFLSDEASWKTTFGEAGSDHERDRPPFGNNNNVFIPLKNGQLLALSTKDGSERWITEDSETGGYMLFENMIYKNTGLRLIEVDSHTGKAGRSIAYRDLLNIPALRMTGEFRVYGDVVLLKDQLRGHVLAINRHSFELQHHLSAGTRFASDKSIIHWHDKQIYALDTDDTLHIS